MDDYIVGEFEIPSFRGQMGAATIGGNRYRRIPVIGLRAALDLRVGKRHLLALQFYRGALDSAPGDVLVELGAGLATSQTIARQQQDAANADREIIMSLLFFHSIQVRVKQALSGLAAHG
jgi:hypothetical protein